VLRLGGRLPEWLPPEFIARAGADGLRSCKRNDTSPSLTELSGVPPENDDRIGVLRTVFSRTYSFCKVRQQQNEFQHLTTTIG